jgi:hypothetical protein
VFVTEDFSATDFLAKDVFKIVEDAQAPVQTNAYNAMT